MGVNLATIPNNIKSGDFLPCYDQSHFLSDVDYDILGPRTRAFSGTDSSELYQANLITQPLDWKYRNQPVKYSVNKQGYRTQDFSTIDWKEAVVIFGCSMVFGVGVDDSDTISNQLSKIINRPVINMGAPSTSITYQLHNSIIFNANYPTPKAVVQLWTAVDRTLYYHDNHIVNHGSWDFEQNDYMEQWALSESHAQVHAMLASTTSKKLWKDIEYIEASFSTFTATLLDCQLIPINDRARDLIHPGEKSIKTAAELIANNLDI